MKSAVLGRLDTINQEYTIRSQSIRDIKLISLEINLHKSENIRAIQREKGKDIPEGKEKK